MSGTSKSNVLPDADSDSTLAKSFVDYFRKKVEDIRNIFSLSEMYDPRQVECAEFNSFQQVSSEAVEKIVTKSKATNFRRDSLLLFSLCHAFIPTFLTGRSRYR